MTSLRTEKEDKTIGWRLIAINPNESVKEGGS
jgi:hypothetical protein